MYHKSDNIWSPTIIESWYENIAWYLSAILVKRWWKEIVTYFLINHTADNISIYIQSYTLHIRPWCLYMPLLFGVPYVRNKNTPINVHKNFYYPHSFSLYAIRLLANKYLRSFHRYSMTWHHPWYRVNIEPIFRLID